MTATFFDFILLFIFNAKTQRRRGKFSNKKPADLRQRALKLSYAINVSKIGNVCARRAGRISCVRPRRGRGCGSGGVWMVRVRPRASGRGRGSARPRAGPNAFFVAAVGR